MKNMNHDSVTSPASREDHRTPRWLSLARCSLLLTGASLSPAAIADPPKAPLAGYELAWADEFDGDALDKGKWAYRTDSKHLSTQKPENVLVRDGVLHLVLKKEAVGGKNYTGAGIISQQAFQYGYFEARMKMPAKAGWHTSFWLQKHDGSGTTDSQEALQGLDVGQNNSSDPFTYTVTLNKYNPEPPANFGYQRLAAPDLSADFHVFGCEFTPEAARFYLDGKLVHTVNASAIQHGEQNLWVTSIASHMGGTRQVDESALPQAALCDYVRVYRKANQAAAPDSP
jgi:beta-glucanase (GH16 family)